MFGFERSIGRDRRVLPKLFCIEVKPLEDSERLITHRVMIDYFRSLKMTKSVQFFPGFGFETSALLITTTTTTTGIFPS